MFVVLIYQVFTTMYIHGFVFNNDLYLGNSKLVWCLPSALVIHNKIKKNMFEKKTQSQLHNINKKNAHACQNLTFYVLQKAFLYW